MKLKELAKSLLNMLFPLRCAGCGIDLAAANETGVCRRCLADIRPNPSPNCGICGRPIDSAAGLCADCVKSGHSFSRAYSACLYEGVMKELIHAFKYKGRISLSRLLSEIMVNFITGRPEITEGIDLATFVPIGRGALGRRGFNQSELLARGISKKLGIPVSGLLLKTRKTRRQNELSRDERLVNLKGVFRSGRAAGTSGKRVLLIDDVMTTGSTLDECARALLGAGAKEVRCLTLARGI